MIDRVAGASLAAVARVAAVVVVAAAFGVDVWLLASPSESLRWSWLMAETVLVTAGLAAAFRPAWVVGLAAAAGTASLAITLGYNGVPSRLTFFTDLAALPLVFGVALLVGTRSSQVAAVLVAVAGLTVGFRNDGGSVALILHLSFVIGFGLAGMAVLYVRLTERERRTSVEVARQAERLELAREIHDVVGHHVTGMIVLAQGQRFAMGSGPPRDDGVLDVLRQIETAGLETMDSVRRLVGTMRIDETTSASLVGDIESLVDDLRATHPLTELLVDDSVRHRALSPEVTRAVHRVVREAVTNVRRHGAGDAAVDCRITVVDDVIVVSIENVMTSEPTGGGFGLVGMRERVELLGGTFRAAPTGPHRWQLCAMLPIDVGAAQ